MTSTKGASQPVVAIAPSQKIFQKLLHSKYNQGFKSALNAGANQTAYFTQKRSQSIELFQNSVLKTDANTDREMMTSIKMQDSSGKNSPGNTKRKELNTSQEITLDIDDEKDTDNKATNPGYIKISHTKMNAQRQFVQSPNMKITGGKITPYKKPNNL